MINIYKLNWDNILTWLFTIGTIGAFFVYYHLLIIERSKKNDDDLNNTTLIESPNSILNFNIIMNRIFLQNKPKSIAA